MPTEHEYPSIVLFRWLSYIYFRYTGEVSFRPLKSASTLGSPKEHADDLNQTPSCSPKSMYRLAASVSQIPEVSY